MQIVVILICLLAPLGILWLTYKSAVLRKVGSIIIAYVIGCTLGLTGLIPDTEEMHGVQTYITDLDKANLTLCQFYFMQVLHELYPAAKIFDANAKRGYGMFDKVMGTDQIRLRFSKNYKVADIVDYFNKDAAAFKAKSSKYYLYK